MVGAGATAILMLGRFQSRRVDGPLPYRRACGRWNDVSLPGGRVKAFPGFQTLRKGRPDWFFLPSRK